jgi:hypothetical protein
MICTVYLVTESQGFLAKVHGEANKPDLAILEVLKFLFSFSVNHRSVQLHKNNIILDTAETPTVPQPSQRSAT